MTTNRERRSRSIFSNPKRVRRFNAGITWPRTRTTTPTAGWGFGSEATSSIISICCTKRLRTPYVVPDNSKSMNGSRLTQFSCLLCATSAFSVSLWLKKFEIQQPQRHREHRGCTEKSVLALRRKLPQSTYVQNQHHALISELGRTGDASALCEWILNGAHHDLALSEYSINRKTHGVCFFTNHEDMKVVATLLIHFENAGESNQGKNFSAIGNDFVVLQLLRR